MRRVVDVDSRQVTVAPDDPVDIRDRWQSLVRGCALDELTGRPVDVACSSPTAWCTPASGHGGIFGLTGRLRAVPTGSPWSIAISADGYVPATISGAFTGVQVTLVDRDLRRSPVRLFGTTVVRPQNTPLDAVDVEMSGIKRRESQAALTAPDVVAVDFPLAARHRTPSTVQVITLADRVLGVGEAPLRLAAAIEAGATAVFLTDASSIVVGQVLRFGAPDQQPEYSTVAGIDPLQPRVQLQAALNARRTVSAPVAAQTEVITSSTPLLDTAEIGDVVLFIAQAAVPTTRTLRILTVNAPTEIRTASAFTSTTGADGQWAFPPINRVCEVSVHVTRPGRSLFPAVAADPTIRVNSVRLSSGSPEQRRDFVLS